MISEQGRASHIDLAVADSRLNIHETVSKLQITAVVQDNRQTQRSWWIWSVIGFVLGWGECDTCQRRLTIHDRSDQYCNDHCGDDLGLGGM